ncbi:MAG: hypothetical protein K0Q49_2089 [Haloplasmataceae bacterium]|jgi:hypothetical protein|nr:hypothetical protein [Haloplasmataceae bacterium]
MNDCIIIEGLYDKGYWLLIEIIVVSKLKDLDRFLRNAIKIL